MANRKKGMGFPLGLRGGRWKGLSRFGEGGRKDLAEKIVIAILKKCEHGHRLSGDLGLGKFRVE